MIGFIDGTMTYEFKEKKTCTFDGYYIGEIQKWIEKNPKDEWLWEWEHEFGVDLEIDA